MEIQGDTKIKIKWLHWSWFLLTFVFLFFRFQNLPGVMTKEGVILNDTDPYYRLHRIDTMLNENRIYPLHDDHLDSPNGIHVSWPLGLDLLIALPLKLYNSKSHAEIESFGAIIIPFLSLPLLWCAGWLGTNLAGPLVGLLLGLMISLSPTLVYQTGLGRLDHHFIEAMLPVGLLMFAYRFMQKKRAYDFGWIVFILSLAPAFASTQWILGPLLVLGLLFSRQWSLSQDYSKIFFLASLFSMIPLSFSERFYSGYVTWVSYSWWPTWIYLCVAVFFRILHLIIERKKFRVQKYDVVITLCFILMGTFLVNKNSIIFFQSNLIGSVHGVIANTGIMATTQEARSPFQMEWERWINFDFHLLVVSAFCFIALLIQRKHLYIVGYSLIGIFLSFLQIRFMAMGLALMFLVTLLFLHDWISIIRIKPLHQKLILIVISVLLILPFKPSLGFSRHGNTHYYFYPIRTFSLFLNNEFKTRKIEKKDQAIIAHWDYGHWLLYYTGLPVIADPFQGPSAMEVLQLFTSKGTEALQPFIQRHPSKYLIIESGAKRSLNWLQSTGKNKDIYFEKTGEMDGQEYFKTTPAFDDLFMFRFFFELGRGLDNNHPQHWRLIYVSPFPSPQENDISALKAFEHVPGLTIHAHTKKVYNALYIQAEIGERKEAFIFQQTAKGTQDFTWTVPYGKYERGGITFNGEYSILDENSKVVFKIKDVTEEAILRGETVKIQF